jgi:hypothetical protein
MAIASGAQCLVSITFTNVALMEDILRRAVGVGHVVAIEAGSLYEQNSVQCAKYSRRLGKDCLRCLHWSILSCTLHLLKRFTDA